MSESTKHELGLTLFCTHCMECGKRHEGQVFAEAEIQDGSEGQFVALRDMKIAFGITPSRILPRVLRKTAWKLEQFLSRFDAL